MIRLYDRALKNISNLLDHCLKLTHRFLRASEKIKEDVPMPLDEKDPIHLLGDVYGLDTQKQRIFGDVLCLLKSSSHEEIREIAECLFSLCDLLFSDHLEAWQKTYDMIVDLEKTLPSECHHETVNFYEVISTWLHKLSKSNSQSSMFGIRTSLQYHRDMDTELTVMTEDDYQEMVSQLQDRLQQYGVEGLKTDDSASHGDHKNPFATLGYEVSQKYFEYKRGSQNTAGENKKHTGLALIQIHVDEGERWTDFIGLADFDQALRLKSLFDIYYLSDKLHVWRGYKEWPTNNRLYCVSLFFPQVCEERENMHRILNHDVANAGFSVEKNRAIFMDQLHDAFEFSDVVFEWNYRQSALRLRNVFERLLKQASRSREPMHFEAFMEAVLEEACLSGDALRASEEMLFEELAKDNASFSLQHKHHSGSDGDHYMAQYDEALMKYKALMSPSRYAETRLHGVAKLNGKPFSAHQFQSLILNLLYDRGMVSFGIPAENEEMSLDQCCTAWSLMIPDNLTLIVYEALLQKDDVFYLQIVPGAYARQIYAILAHHKISNQFRVYIHGRRRFF